VVLFISLELYTQESILAVRFPVKVRDARLRRAGIHHDGRVAGGADLIIPILHWRPPRVNEMRDERHELAKALLAGDRRKATGGARADPDRRKQW
jgi:hypothetical protein